MPTTRTDYRVETALEAVQRIIHEVEQETGRCLHPGTEMSVRPELFRQLQEEVGEKCIYPTGETYAGEPYVMVDGVRIDGNLKPRGRD